MTTVQLRHISAMQLLYRNWKRTHTHPETQSYNKYFMKQCNMLVVTHSFHFITQEWVVTQFAKHWIKVNAVISSWQNQCARDFLKITPELEWKSKGGVSLVKERSLFFWGSQLFLVFPKSWEHTAGGKGLPRGLYSVAFLTGAEGFCCLRKPEVEV